jgi:hypothetical protein
MPARVRLGIPVEEEHRRPLTAHDCLDLRVPCPKAKLAEPREQDLVG